MGDIKIKVEDLQDAVAQKLSDYGDYIVTLTSDGLDDAEKVLISNLKEASPSKTGEFKKSWKGRGKKYKLHRYVGNTKTVKGKKGDLPLSNILEYGEKSPVQGFMKRTYEASIGDMAQAIVDKIREG